MNNIEAARLKYKPEHIKCLLISETPPKPDSRRFFYYESVDIQDHLFLETMKALYPKKTENMDTKAMRDKKQMFLEKLKNDGFYLIDALDEPFDTSYSNSQKLKLFKAGQKGLLDKITSLIGKETGVILISAPVYYANNTYLKQNGVNILNTESIDFPGSGKQDRFREKMSEIIKKEFNKSISQQ